MRSRVLALAIATLLGVELASGRTYAPAQANAPFAIGIAVVLGVLAILWTRLPRQVAVPPGRWLGALVVVSGLVAVMLRASWVRGPVTEGPLLGIGLVALAGLGIAGFGSLRGRIAPVVGGAVIAGLALRFFQLQAVAIDPQNADMMPLVVLALRSLAKGDAVYRMYHLPWGVPLTYLPLNWLAYAPLFYGGVDPRWTNALAELAVLGAIVFVARKRTDKAGRDAAATLWAAWFVSNATVAFDAGVAAAPQWAAMAWAAALVLRRHKRASVGFGLALATTPLAAPLLPAVLLAARKKKWDVLAIALGVALVLTLPWFALTPKGFVDGVVLWFNDLDHYPRAKWTESRAWCVDPGLACAFWSAGLERALKPLQVAAVGLLAWRFWRDRSPARLGPTLVATYLAFVALNPIAWNYLWEPALVLALVTLAATRAPHLR